MQVINLFGAPGSGKSTGAARIFSELKLNGYNAELITEFAKDKVWEQIKAVFENQLYIFSNQDFRLSRISKFVDLAITDSPLPLSILYDNNLGETFHKLVMERFNLYDNINYFIIRDKPYVMNGRFQTEKESEQLAYKMLEMLNQYNIKTQTVYGNIEGYNKIVSDIKNLKKS